MKLSKELLTFISPIVTEGTDQKSIDRMKALAQRISAEKGVVQHVNKNKENGEIYVSDWYDDDETIATYNNGKLKEDVVAESRYEDGEKIVTADQLEVGDTVSVANGHLDLDGAVGVIDSFGIDKKFVVVKLFGGKGLHSFHSSDIIEETSDEDNDDEEDDEGDEDTFYVGIYDEDEDKSFIGKVSKSNSSKWHESEEKGTAPYKWGGTYMSYLKPHDVMSWIYKDYNNGYDIKGPYDTAAEAEEYFTRLYGPISEAVKAPSLKQVEAAKTKYDGFGLKIENAKKSVGFKRGTGVIGDLQRKQGDAYTAYMELKKAYDAANNEITEGTDGKTANALRIKEKADFDRMMAGAMSRDEFNKKWKKGKYAEKSGKYKLDPTGAYHNLIKGVDEAAFKVNFSKSALDNLEAFAGTKMKTSRMVIAGYPVDIDEDSDADNVGFSAVDKGTGTDLMKALRAVGFSVKRFDDTEFMITLKKQIKEEAESFTVAELKAELKEILADVVDDYKKHAKTGQTTAPSAPNTGTFKSIKYGMVELAPNTIVHGSYGMSYKYDLFVKVGGQIPWTVEKEMIADTKKAISQLIGKDVSSKERFTISTSDGYDFSFDTTDGSAWSGFGFRVRRDSSPVKEAQSYTDFDDWKQAVLNSYPVQAKKIKFKGRMEGGKDTISAEVPGEDRSYGVWDADKEKGVVLSETVVRKGSVAYEIAQRRKAAEKDPAEIKRIEKIGDSDHMVGTAKVSKDYDYSSNFNAALFKNAFNRWFKKMIAKYPDAEVEQINHARWEAYNAGKQIGYFTDKDDFLKEAEAKQEYRVVCKDKSGKEVLSFARLPAHWSFKEAAADYKKLGMTLVKLDKVDGKGQPVKEGSFNDGMKARAGELVNKLKTKSLAPRKGTMAYEIMMNRKASDKDPEAIKKTEKVGDKNHMFGAAKVKHVDEGPSGEQASLLRNPEYVRHNKEAFIAREMEKTCRQTGDTKSADQMKKRAEEHEAKVKEIKAGLKEGFSPYKLGAKVQIIAGPKDAVGKIGFIGEIRTGPSATSPKTFTIDYDADNKSTQPNFGAKSIQLKAKDIKLVK